MGPLMSRRDAGCDSGPAWTSPRPCGWRWSARPWLTPPRWLCFDASWGFDSASGRQPGT